MKNLSEELVQKLKLYREIAAIFRSSLPENDLKEIEETIERLEKLELKIAVFGRVNTGKSSLLNSLIGYSNKDPNRPFKNDAIPNIWDEYIEKKSAVVWKEISSIKVLIQDTPGIGGDYPEHHHKAVQIANGSDIILFMTSECIVGTEKKALDGLVEIQKPLIIVLNQCDVKTDDQIEAMKTVVMNNWPSLGNNMVLAAGDPNPKISKDPIIDDLVEMIGLVIQAKQEELIWKTVDSHLRDKKDLVISTILSQKKQSANEIIHGSAVSASALSAALPTPLDAAGLTAIHIAMVQKLGGLFSQELDKTAAVTILGLLVGFVGGTTIAKFAMNFLPPGISNATRAITTLSHTEGLGWSAYAHFKNEYDPLNNML